MWTYILDNSVPYNALHDQNYPSIGCTNCTKPVMPGDDPRSGRWQGRTRSSAASTSRTARRRGYDRLHEDGEGA